MLHQQVIKVIRLSAVLSVQGFAVSRLVGPSAMTHTAGSDGFDQTFALYTLDLRVSHTACIYK